MTSNRSNLFIGYHGCDEKVRNQIILNPNSYKISEKPYDWLGHGFYIWENNYERALQWAKSKKEKGGIKKPSVVGVLYTLDNCLDFTDSIYIDSLQVYYEDLVLDIKNKKKEIPINKNALGDGFQDKIIRELDCAVIEHLHEKVKQESIKSNSKIFSIRHLPWYFY